MAEELKLPTDRFILSTENNEYAEGVNDESRVGELAEEVPLTDEIPDAVNETGEEQRPLYNEGGLPRESAKSSEIQRGNNEESDIAYLDLK